MVVFSRRKFASSERMDASTMGTRHRVVLYHDHKTELCAICIQWNAACDPTAVIKDSNSCRALDCDKSCLQQDSDRHALINFHQRFKLGNTTAWRCRSHATHVAKVQSTFSEPPERPKALGTSASIRQSTRQIGIKSKINRIAAR